MLHNALLCKQYIYINTIVFTKEYDESNTVVTQLFYFGFSERSADD